MMAGVKKSFVAVVFAVTSASAFSIPTSIGDLFDLDSLLGIVKESLGLDLAAIDIQCKINESYNAPDYVVNDICRFVKLPSLKIDLPYCTVSFNQYGSYMSRLRSVCNNLVTTPKITRAYNERGNIIKLANINVRNSNAVNEFCSFEIPGDYVEDVVKESLDAVLGYKGQVIRDYEKISGERPDVEKIYSVDPGESEQDAIERVSKNVKDLAAEISYTSSEHIVTTDREILNATKGCYESENKNEIAECVSKYFNEEGEKTEEAKKEADIKEGVWEVAAKKAASTDEGIVYPLESVLLKAPRAISVRYKWVSYKMFRVDILASIFRERIKALEKKVIELERQRRAACAVRFPEAAEKKIIEETIESIGALP